MFYFAHVKHLTQHLGDFHTCSTNQDWTTGIYHLFNFFDNCFVFLALCFVNAVIHVVSDDRAVCRYFNYVKFINVPKLTGFGACRTCHTSKLVVHTEIVLKRYSCKSLRSSFNLYVFLCFNCLMQTVAPTATFHYTSGLFIYDFYLSVYNNIVIIAIKHGICFEQLLQCMYTLTLYGIVCKEFIFLV